MWFVPKALIEMDMEMSYTNEWLNEKTWLPEPEKWFCLMCRVVTPKIYDMI